MICGAYHPLPPLPNVHTSIEHLHINKLYGNKIEIVPLKIYGQNGGGGGLVLFAGQSNV